jgi:UDP-glucuronate 4-epimerase
MRVLITGGAGFIGSHVAQQLIHEGHEIAIVDDLNDFYSPDLKLSNLREVRQAGSFRFYEEDIRDESAMREVFAAVRPEAVIHLAARAGVRPSLEQPLLYESVNVRGHACAAGTESLMRRVQIPVCLFQFGIRKRGPSAVQRRSQP